MFDGHQGPVTGISCHNSVGPVDFSHLFTTSSFDWTVKLWSTKVRVVLELVLLYMYFDYSAFYKYNYSISLTA